MTDNKHINHAQASEIRPDYRVILGMVDAGSRVLDLGCGGGELLELLSREKEVTGQGVEIEPNNISACVGRGVSAIQGDVDEGLADYPDRSFDYVILNQTLQVVRAPDRVLTEMVRVGRAGIVGFPNFGYWEVRLRLLFGGRMPVTEELPYSWYSTPNIHMLSIKDFEEFCTEAGIEIMAREYVTRGGGRAPSALSNIAAAEAVYMIKKNGD